MNVRIKMIVYGVMLVNSIVAQMETTEFRLADAEPNEGIVDSKQMIHSARVGDVNTMQAVLNKGVDVNHIEKRSYTALIAASAAGDFEMVQFLLDDGADVDLRDSDGDTALMKAMKNNHLEIMAILLEKASVADIDRVECFLETSSSDDSYAAASMVLAGSRKPESKVAKNIEGDYVIDIDDYDSLMKLMIGEHYYEKNPQFQQLGTEHFLRSIKYGFIFTGGKIFITKDVFPQGGQTILDIWFVKKESATEMELINIRSKTSSTVKQISESKIQWVNMTDGESQIFPFKRL